MGSRKLNREILGLNGIEFSEDENPTWKPGAHIASLKTELLNFRNVVSTSAMTQPQYAEKHPKIPDFGLLYPGTDETRKRFDLASKICKKSKELKSNDEDVWRNLIGNRLFRNLGDDKRPTRPESFFSTNGAIAKNGPNIPWPEAATCRELPSEIPLTHPKPDIYFAIPVFRLEQSPMGFLNQALQNLSLEALYTYEGLTCSPSIHLSKCKSPKKHQKHRVCFPFAVVEVKPDTASKGEIEKCYCQAANAASCALAMLCQLCQHTPNAKWWHGELNQVLPVVTFTFIGYKAKVWLAYVSQYRWAETEDHRFVHQYHVQCIWSGDLRILLDAAQLCSLIDRLGEWFLYIYRPWICACLDQWISRQEHRELRKSFMRYCASDPSIEVSFKGDSKRWLQRDETEDEVSDNDNFKEGHYDQSGVYYEEVGSASFKSGDDETYDEESYGAPSTLASHSNYAPESSSPDDDRRYNDRKITIIRRECSLLRTPSPPPVGGAVDDDDDDGPVSSRTRWRTAQRALGRFSKTAPRQKGERSPSPSRRNAVVEAARKRLQPLAKLNRIAPSTLALPMRRW